MGRLGWPGSLGNGLAEHGQSDFCRLILILIYMACPKVRLFPMCPSFFSKYWGRNCLESHSVPTTNWGVGDKGLMRSKRWQCSWDQQEQESFSPLDGQPQWALGPGEALPRGTCGLSLGDTVMPQPCPVVGSGGNKSLASLSSCLPVSWYPPLAEHN